MIPYIDSLRYCRRVTRESGSSFVAAFRFLTPDRRDAMDSLYAFLRLSDDLGDESDIPLDLRRERFQRWRSVLNEFVLNGNCESAETAFPNEAPVFPALAETFRRFDIPRYLLADVATGIASDLVPSVRMKVLNDVLTYCDRVAGAVGLAVLSIFGSRRDIDSPDIHSAAMACGRAFQWTNFLRDIGEDLDADRVYFPLTDFNHNTISLSDFCSRPLRTDRSANEFFQLQHARTIAFYEQSKPLVEQVDPECRAVFLMMWNGYFLLFRKLQRNNFRAFHERMTLSQWTKWRLALSPLISSAAHTRLFGEKCE